MLKDVGMVMPKINWVVHSEQLIIAHYVGRSKKLV